jgi:response regulator RpfG family c-di-GMP phosphodiesterase
MIPVVALTANAVKGDREKYLETGMNDYLSKPIDNAELLRVLSVYLKKESGEEKVRQPAEKVAEQYSEKYDKQKSLAKVGIKEQDYDMIIDQLFKSLDDDLRRLEKAILDEDINSIYSIIHYLKGAASNLQLTPVAKLLEKYNDKAKTGVVKGYDTEKIRALFEEIRKQI